MSVLILVTNCAFRRSNRICGKDMPRSACSGSTLAQACLGSAHACSALDMSPQPLKGRGPVASFAKGSMANAAPDELSLSRPEPMIHGRMRNLARLDQARSKSRLTKDPVQYKNKHFPNGSRIDTAESPNTYLSKRI